MLRNMKPRPRAVAAMPGGVTGLVQTESGIITPASSIAKPEKKAETITSDDFKKLTRVVLDWKRHRKVSMVMLCDGCQRPIVLVPERGSMECECTIRSVRGVR